MPGKGATKRIKRAIKGPIRNLAKDWAFGIALPRAYAKAAAASVDPNKVLFLDVKSSEMPDAFSVMYPYVRDELGLDATFIGLGQNQGISWAAYYKNCLDLMPELATAKYVFLCDACDVVSCVPLREETKVVQLWHACGAFKKWGASTAELQFGGTRKELERHPFYKNLSLVTVSSPDVSWAYREAMMLEDTPEVVQPLGVSRTDVFFDDDYRSAARRHVEEAVPRAKGSRIVLYAPTFRGSTDDATGPDALDIRAMRSALGDKWFLLIKHHPYVKNPPAIPEDCRDFAAMVSDMPADMPSDAPTGTPAGTLTDMPSDVPTGTPAGTLTDMPIDVPISELLCAADLCITDYSSIVFEYSLFDRPMAFFAFDRDTYEDWRGFYYDYDEMTPGLVASTTEEIIDHIRDIDNKFDIDEVRAFRKNFMCACDGHATERICRFVMS